MTASEPPLYLGLDLSTQQVREAAAAAHYCAAAASHCAASACMRIDVAPATRHVHVHVHVQQKI